MNENKNKKSKSPKLPTKLCPKCGIEPLTPREIRLGYQCVYCTRREEGL